MTLSANAIQKAIYQRLSSQLSVPVYDYVPEDSKMPYVVIGADTSIPWDTKGSEGQEYTCTIHAWDALKAGRKSVKALMEQIYAALHRQETALAGLAVTEIRQEYAESRQEAGIEGEADNYYYGVMRFRALVEG